jgi:hypothetical protein
LACLFGFCAKCFSRGPANAGPHSAKSYGDDLKMVIGVSLWLLAKREAMFYLEEHHLRGEKMESLGEIAVTAQRNRRIKKILSTHFGKGKVRVRGHGADWVVKIDSAPTSVEHQRELETNGS